MTLREEIAREVLWNEYWEEPEFIDRLQAIPECDGWKAALATADRIIALLAPPEGWVMVPREPTEEMFDATKPAFKQIDGMIVEMAVARGRPLTPHPEGSPLLRAWKAMLASAPPPPIPSGVEG